MTRFLLVDDDPRQLHLLARVISARGNNVDIVTASNGEEAIVALRSTSIDVVLTDLQMPGMDGFDLVAWLLSHQPHVSIFTMTAYPDAPSVDRLQELGSLGCFTKPVDVRRLLFDVEASLAEGVRGHVRNISLASFLQLVEMERQTCTLHVESRNEFGQLYLDNGVLVDAQTKDQQGQAAATAIVSWPSPAITILGSCAPKRHSITAPLNFILMEAMRLRDEADRAAAAQQEPVSQCPESDVGAPWSRASNPPPIVGSTCPGEHGEVSDPDADSGERKRRRTISEFPAYVPAGADAIAVVCLSSGRVQTLAGRTPKLESLARLAAVIHQTEEKALEQLELNDPIRELILTTPSYWILSRPVKSVQGSLAVLVFDPKRANVVMERLELDGYLDRLDSWIGRLSN